MFSSISLTIGAATVTLQRINQDQYGSEFLARDSGSETRFRVRHSKYVDKKRNSTAVERHNVELIRTVYGTAGAPDAQRKIYAVIENDYRDDIALVEDVATGLIDWLTSANVTELLNWQN